MVGPQSPASPIFLPAQAVSAADVAAKHLGAIAALQADHIIPTHGLANRYSGGECFFDRSLSSKLTEASVYDDDEFRNLTCPDLLCRK